MVAAVLSSIISSFFPHFSINYISIFVGLIIGLVPFLNGRIPPFHTEIFMYIVAPLIYFEGQSTRINLIGKKLRQILETAVLLVIVGTVFAGFSVSLLGIPLALAFLMGALSTPTDATATESILLDTENEY
ncbi:cation:proton antiporter domain-containing protein [Limosilactobacillus reuteri]|uniref:cation:proton antiporter domain-containing protein n=1 Tax=Limosilactobacillus reuteri TaxID=1598 RepID=UPI001CDB5E3B|nr:cation:proton antiporter [Limosilactobacillus reuteri]